MLQGSERIRLITMLGTLCILGMLIFHAVRPGTKKPPAEREVEQTPADRTPESATAGKAANTQKSPEKEAVAAGPTDEDPEEQAAAKDEFQALADGTLGIQPEEMFAYRRVFDWVAHQSFAELKKGAEKDVPLDDLMRTPSNMRGKVIQVDLDVRQAIPFEDKSLGDEKLYEIRGFSEDSGAWLYFAIVPELPAGMKIGAHVEERVRVEGYFLKLQGYLEAGAKPRAASLKAPLLIGRAKRLTSSDESAAPADNNWLYAAAACFVLLSFIVTLVQFIARRKAKRHQSQLEECKVQRSRDWPERDKPSDGDTACAPGRAEDEPEEGFDFKKGDV